TQIVASAMVAYLKSKDLYKGKFAVTFSDFHFHIYFSYPFVDYYLANVEEQKKDLEVLGFDSKKIFVLGITLKPKQEFNSREVFEKYGLNIEKPVVLVSAGSQGFTMPTQLVSALARNLDASIV